MLCFSCSGLLVLALFFTLFFVFWGHAQTPFTKFLVSFVVCFRTFEPKQTPRQLHQHTNPSPFCFFCFGLCFFVLTFFCAFIFWLFFSCIHNPATPTSLFCGGFVLGFFFWFVLFFCVFFFFVVVVCFFVFVFFFWFFCCPGCSEAPTRAHHGPRPPTFCLVIY